MFLGRHRSLKISKFNAVDGSPFCSIRFSRRSVNKVAHALAQEGIKCDVNSFVSWDYVGVRVRK
jgi:hypothetical protein